MPPNPSHLAAVPSVSNYKAAFHKIKVRLSPGHMAMLRAQYAAPQHTLTARKLAQAAGYKNSRGANLQYGKIGTLLREALNYWADDGQASYVLSHFYGPIRAKKEEWSFIMHREVAQALRELKWFH